MKRELARSKGMKSILTNPKPENRSAKEIRKPRPESALGRGGGSWDFGLRASFGFRSSVLGFPALFLLALSFQLSVFAQSYSIDWFTIDGGGGTSAGGIYSVSGTIGQPDASATPMSGGSFSLAGGFWSLPGMGQTPDAPLLTIRLTATNTAVVSWPSPSIGFNLQQNVNLGTSNWTTPPEPVTDDGTNKLIIINPQGGERFYRLYKP
jgi:hypothetical protein